MGGTRRANIPLGPPEQVRQWCNLYGDTVSEMKKRTGRPRNTEGCNTKAKAYLESLECRVRNGSFKPSHIPSEEDERRAQERASSGQILRRADRRDF